MDFTSFTMKKDDGDIQLACVLFAAVGVGYLFPFSALTQPVDYWNKIFPDFNIEFPLTTLYLWTNLIVLGLIVFLGGTPSYTFRIVGGFVGQLLVLVSVPSFYFLGLDEGTHFFLIMAATAFAAVTTALVDSVAISFAAQYPLRVQEALQFGIGFSTLIGSIYRIVTKLIFPPSHVVQSSLLYFYSGAATIVLCIYAYYLLLSLPISKRCLRFGITVSQENLLKLAQQDRDQIAYAMAQQDECSDRGAYHDVDGYCSVGSNLDDIKTTSKVNKNIPSKTTDVHAATTNSRGDIEMHKTVTTYGAVETVQDYDTHIHMTDSDSEQEYYLQNLVVDKWVLLKKVAFNEFVVFLVFFSTLLLWPPLITEIKSFNFPELQETRWWPLLLLALFAVADCLGRLATPYRLFFTVKNMWIAVLVRFLLFPLIICLVKGIYFTNDCFSVLFVFALGFTNGYLGTLSILFVNESVTAAEKGVTGTFTGFFLNLGLVFGATGGMIVEKLVLNH